MSIKIRNSDSQTIILKEKVITEKGRAKKQSQKLWERMLLSLNQNKMLKTNSKNKITTLSSNTFKSIKTNTSTETSTITEIPHHTIIMQVPFLKINEKMMKLWDRTQSSLQEEATIQGCIQTHTIEMNQRRNLSGKKRNDSEELQPKRLNNSYIRSRITSWWKTPYGRNQSNQELNFEIKSLSNLSFGKTVTSQKYLYSQTTSSTLKTPCFHEMSKLKEKLTIIWTIYSMRASYRKD